MASQMLVSQIWCEASTEEGPRFWFVSKINKKTAHLQRVGTKGLPNLDVDMAKAIALRWGPDQIMIWRLLDEGAVHEGLFNSLNFGFSARQLAGGL